MPIKKLSIALICLLFSGCGTFEPTKSDKFSPTEIHHTYKVNGNNNFTTIDAIFSVVKSPNEAVELVAPSQIEFNGKTLGKTEGGMFKRHAYYFQSLYEYPSNQVFTFTDADGKKENYEIVLNKLEIADDNLEVSLSKGGTFSLSRAIESDEELLVSLHSTVLPPATNTNENSPNLKYGINYQAKLNPERTKVIIEPFSLGNFVLGKAIVSVFVSKNKEINNSGVGVSLHSQYQSTGVTINVKS